MESHFWIFAGHEVKQCSWIPSPKYKNEKNRNSRKGQRSSQRYTLKGTWTLERFCSYRSVPSHALPCEEEEQIRRRVPRQKRSRHVPCDVTLSAFLWRHRRSFKADVLLRFVCFCIWFCIQLFSLSCSFALEITIYWFVNVAGVFLWFVHCDTYVGIITHSWACVDDYKFCKICVCIYAHVYTYTWLSACMHRIVLISLVIQKQIKGI